MYIRKVLFLFKLSLVLVLCFTVVRTLITPQYPAGIFKPSPAGGTENIISDRIENRVEDSIEDYSPLVAQNIFGVTDISDVEDKSSEAEEFDDVMTLAGEELNLELLGTVCGNEEVSRAIIKNTKNNQLGMYKTGQSISGARINSIEQNSVILHQNGRRKILTLKRIDGNKSSAEVLSSPSINKTNKAVSVVLPDTEPLSETSTKMANLETILAEAAIEPYLVEGQVEGLRITDCEKIPMAKTFGLKDGDIILQVNGHRLTSKQKAFQVFKKAKSQTTVNLELLSNGETKELSFTLQ